MTLSKLRNAAAVCLTSLILSCSGTPVISMYNAPTLENEIVAEKNPISKIIKYCNFIKEDNLVQEAFNLRMRIAQVKGEGASCLHTKDYMIGKRRIIIRALNYNLSKCHGTYTRTGDPYSIDLSLPKGPHTMVYSFGLPQSSSPDIYVYGPKIIRPTLVCADAPYNRFCKGFRKISTPLLRIVCKKEYQSLWDLKKSK